MKSIQFIILLLVCSFIVWGQAQQIETIKPLEGHQELQSQIVGVPQQKIQATIADTNQQDSQQDQEQTQDQDQESAQDQGQDQGYDDDETQYYSQDQDQEQVSDQDQDQDQWDGQTQYDSQDQEQSQVDQEDDDETQQNSQDEDQQQVDGENQQYSQEQDQVNEEDDNETQYDSQDEDQDEIQQDGETQYYSQDEDQGQDQFYDDETQYDSQDQDYNQDQDVIELHMQSQQPQTQSQDQSQSYRPPSLRNQLQVLFGQNIIQSFLENFPENEYKIQEFDDLRNYVYEWVDQNEDFIAKYLDSQVQEETYNTGNYGFGELLPLNQLVEIRKALEILFKQASDASSTGQTVEEFDDKEYQVEKVISIINKLLKLFNQIFEHSSKFFGNYYYTQTYSIQQNRFGGYDTSSRQNCSIDSTQTFYEIQLEYYIYFGNQQISWEQFKQISENQIFDPAIEDRLMQLFLEARGQDASAFKATNVNEQVWEKYLERIDMDEDQLRQRLGMSQLIYQSSFTRYDRTQITFDCLHDIWIYTDNVNGYTEVYFA